MKKRHHSTSVWHTSPVPHFPRLDSRISADVCVVGAGISGLSVAHQLVEEGLKVAVLESNTIGSGQTGRTTAHLVNALDDRYFELRRLFGLAGAKLAAESHTAAIDRIEKIVHDLGLDCEFLRVDGYLFAAPEHNDDYLRRELQAAHDCGLQSTELSQIPISGISTLAIRFPRQAQFHPIKYLSGLAHRIARKGGKIFSHTHVASVEPITPSSVRVYTRRGQQVDAHSVVIATDTPINNRFALHTKQHAYTSYVVGFHTYPGKIEPMLLWDTGDPYHYVRSYDSVFLVGGEDHRTGQKTDQSERFKKLEHWARARFDNLAELRFCWSGQVQEPVDGLAYCGRNPGDLPNVYVVTGDSGNGMTHGTIAGMLIPDLIMGRENHWEKLYRPRRINSKAASKFVRENINTFGQYADWVNRSAVRSVDDIPPDSGAVIQNGLRKVAVFRDSLGRLHERSAMCTHLGGLVAWNEQERTWDCPCHGSQFDRQGRVIQGPATQDLEPVNMLETPERTSSTVKPLRDETAIGLKAN